MKQDKIIKTISLDRITYNALVDMAREDKRPLSQYIRVQLDRVVENNNLNNEKKGE